jgi:hypothetical protein
MGDITVGHWHLANPMEVIRNTFSLANLERIETKDSILVAAIKNYIEERKY